MSFPNTIQGGYGDPYGTDAVRQFPLGQRMACPNGKVYRYAEMGAIAGVAAKLYSSEAPKADWDTLVTTTTITALTSTSVSYTNGATNAVAEDELMFGYVCVEETTFLGESHRIARNAYAPAGGVGTVWLLPGDVFQVTVTLGDVITVVKSPYKDVVVTPAAATLSSMPVGVPQVAIAANQFGWVQTHGVCSILTDGTVVIGKEARVSETIEGAVCAMDYDEAAAIANLGVVARVIEVAPTTDFGTYFLTIEGLS